IIFSYCAGGGRRQGTSGAMVFLNRTSLHPIYTSRLIRAYLGASNKVRQDNPIGLSEVLPDDDISHERYWFEPEPFFYHNGAPLHLVNMPLNETVAGETQVEQRDRRGMGMAVGPAGLSVGVRHHAVYQDRANPEKMLVKTYPAPGQFRVFDYRDPQRQPDDPV